MSYLISPSPHLGYNQCEMTQLASVMKYLAFTNSPCCYQEVAVFAKVGPNKSSRRVIASTVDQCHA
jgi:hypothetical protein